MARKENFLLQFMSENTYRHIIIHYKASLENPNPLPYISKWPEKERGKNAFTKHFLDF